MTTSSGPFLDPEHATHVEHMPPMVVTTTGIPDTEHVTEKEHAEVPPSADRPSHANRWVALALAGVLAASVGAIVYVANQPVPVTNPRMGLSDTAWAEYRAGERAVATVGVGTADWQTYRTGERASIITSGPGSADWQSYRSGERG